MADETHSHIKQRNRMVICPVCGDIGIASLKEISMCLKDNVPNEDIVDGLPKWKEKEKNGSG